MNTTTEADTTDPPDLTLTPQDDEAFLDYLAAVLESGEDPANNPHEEA